jgi:hypothetical protein
VRLVAEARPEQATEWAALTSVAAKLGVSDHITVLDAALTQIPDA